MTTEEAGKHPLKENVVTAVIRGGGETTFRHGLIGKLGVAPQPKKAKPETPQNKQGQVK